MYGRHRLCVRFATRCIHNVTDSQQHTKLKDNGFECVPLCDYNKLVASAHKRSKYLYVYFILCLE